VMALHFGPETSARKIYIQTSLHADELPGALLAFHLRPVLERLEANGQIKAHIVLVPLCNPLGLSQSLLYESAGRFDLFTGRNFNRLVDLNLYDRTARKLRARADELSGDELKNVQLIRSLMQEVIQEYQPKTQVDMLQHILVGLAYDADVVLDLHCDEQAVMHMYTLPQLWERAEPLARYLGSHCQILSEDSQSHAFDELLSTPWLKLSKEFNAVPIPCACLSTTVELRHDLACADVEALVQFLAHLGDIDLLPEQVQPMPDLLRLPHPLTGLDYILAPTSGVVVYHAAPGDWVEQQQLVAEIVDPIHQILTPIYTQAKGLIFARHHVHYAQQGAILLSLSSPEDLGRGETLGP
jgi:uncharacterized protein